MCARRSPPAEEIQIMVKNVASDTVSSRGVVLSVKTSDTIASVKAKLQHKNGSLPMSYRGIAPDQQRLIFNGKELDDEHTLTACNIRRNSTLIIVRRLSAVSGSLDADALGSSGTDSTSMQIFIQDSLGKTIFVVTTDDTIADLKAKIQERRGKPPDQQRIVFDGQYPEDVASFPSTTFRTRAP